MAIQLKSNGQEVNVTSGFLKDSAQIGEPVGFYLSVTYPKELTVLFPDTLFNFAPFEFNKKQFFPTHTSNGISNDSVLYYLSTFEVEKIQYLSLPVFVVAARDCTTYTSFRDSISLIELVKNPAADSLQAQSLPLKTNTLYEKVFTQFNYIIVVVVSIVLLSLVIAVWIIFGKRIRLFFTTKRLQKNHTKFMQAFTNYIQQLNIDFSREKTERTVSLWKKYLEQLEQLPYTKLTTRETLQLEPNEQLGNSLKRIDRIIYGNQTDVVEPLLQLQEFAVERFQKKVEEIKHG